MEHYSPMSRRPEARRRVFGSEADTCPNCGARMGQRHDPECMQHKRESSRGRRPFDRRRSGIEDEFDNFQKKKPGLSSSPAVDVENFVQQKQQGGSVKGNGAKPGAPATGKPRFGPKAINKLKTMNGLPPEMQIGPTGTGISARRRQGKDLAESGYPWSKAPSTVKSEFQSRLANGLDAEGTFRQMLAEIAEHHEAGKIGSHDAHRAANEAFGRLLLSRKRQAAGEADRGIGHEYKPGMHDSTTENGWSRGMEHKADPPGSPPCAMCGEAMNHPMHTTHQRHQGARGRRPLAQGR